MRVLCIFQQGAGSGNGRVQTGAAEALQIAGAKLRRQFVQGRVQVELPGRQRLGSALGVVEGGKGKLTEAFGGGNGHAVGRNAPPEAVEFLKFIAKVDNQRKAAASGAVLPVIKGAEDAIKDPNQLVVSKALAAASGFQLYLDQAFAPAVGQQVNDSVAELMAGKASPEQVCKAVTDAAGR